MKQFGKKLTAAALALAMTAVSFPVLSPVAEAKRYPFGDIDLSDSVDATDLTLLARAVARIETLPEDGYESDGTHRYPLGDLDLDGMVAASDLSALARHVGNIQSLPANGVYGYAGKAYNNPIYTVIQPDDNNEVNITVPIRIENPLMDVNLADPEMRRFTVDGKDEFWIYGTGNNNIAAIYSDDYMATWKSGGYNRGNVLDLSSFPWAKNCIWAPGAIKHGDKYYLVFAANNVPDNSRVGGIGIGVSDHPGGPFTPVPGSNQGLIIDQSLYGITEEDDWNTFRAVFEDKPNLIDACLFEDEDGEIYLYYGGGRYCGVCRMKEDLSGVRAFPDGDMYKVITAGLNDYVEGPFMIKRGGTYYMMYSKGSWGDGSYASCYAKADSPIGPFYDSKQITRSSPDDYPYKGPGHNSAVYLPESNLWLICYHRWDRDDAYRTPCIERMAFDDNGDIRAVVLTDGWTSDDYFGPDQGNLALWAQPIDCGRGQYGAGSLSGLADGDRASYWQPNGGAGYEMSNMWAGFDFGTDTTFNFVQIEWEYDTKCTEDGVEIQISSDGVNWTTVSDVTVNYGNVTTYSFPAVTSRYMRANMVKGTNDKYCPKIFEIEVRANET